jgi:hypothetical protein
MSLGRSIGNRWPDGGGQVGKGIWIDSSIHRYHFDLKRSNTMWAQEGTPGPSAHVFPSPWSGNQFGVHWNHRSVEWAVNLSLLQRSVFLP